MCAKLSSSQVAELKMIHSVSLTLKSLSQLLYVIALSQNLHKPKLSLSIPVVKVVLGSLVTIPAMVRK